MALPFGPILLITIVGAAVVGGLDLRKKKKNGSASGGGQNGGGGQTDEVVACAHVIDISADGKKAILDGWKTSSAGWQPIEMMDDHMWWAIERQRPQVLFTVCEPDPTTMALLEQFCQQNPDIEFYGIYASRLTGVFQQQVLAKCQEENYIAGFTVYTPTGPDSGRVYIGNEIPELTIHPGTNIANVIATVLAFSRGADHPAAEDYFTE